MGFLYVCWFKNLLVKLVSAYKFSTVKPDTNELNKQILC